ncbi:MAG: hypothetical protein AAGG72_07450 [Pseudomonadota bacterium]
MVTTKKTDRKARRKQLAVASQMRQLMDVAEAARLAMGPLDDTVPTPRLMIEKLSDPPTAEDAWRADRYAPQQRARQARTASARPTHAAQYWMPTGLMQLLGGRAVA